MADFEGAPPGTSAEEIRAARKASREEAAALKLAEEAKNNPKPEAESSNKKPKTSGTSKSDSATSSNANGGGENLGPGFINPSNLLNNATGSSSAIDGNSNSNSISSLLNNDNNGAETSAAGAAEKDGNGNGAGEKRKREENNQSDEIGSDLDDDDDEGEENLADVEGEDIGLCLYDKVSSRFEFSEMSRTNVCAEKLASKFASFFGSLLSFILACIFAGSKSQEQVEMCFERWNRFSRWKRLPFFKMQRRIRMVDLRTSFPRFFSSSV